MMMIIIIRITVGVGMGVRSRYNVSRRAGRSGDRIPVGGGRNFSHPTRPALGPIQPPIEWVPGHSPEAKAAGAWR